MDFHSNFTIKAIWNVSNTSEFKIFGELEYTQEKGIEVEAFGSFYGTASIHKLKNGIEEQQILGFAKDGEFISLIDCTLYENGSSKGLITTKIYAKYLLKSKEYPLTNFSKVAGINAHLPLLDKWLDLKSSFKYGFTNEQNSLTLKYKQPKTKTLYEDNEFLVYIYFSWNTEFGSRWLQKTSLQQRAFLNIEFKRNLDLIPAIDFIIYLKRLFVLFTMHDVRFNEMNAFVKDKGDQKRVQLLFKDEGRYNLGPLDSDILIYYSEIKRKFRNIIKNWIIKRESFEDLLGYFFDIKHRLAANQKNIFLNLCFSLEKIHQTFYDKKPFNIKKVQNLKSTINSVIPKDFRQRINDVLLHFNELTFSQRLKILITKNSVLVSIFLSDSENFVSMVKNTRNSFVHKTNIKKEKTISSDKLIHYNNALILILEITILTQMKVPSETIRKFIRRDFGSYYIKANLS